MSSGFTEEPFGPEKGNGPETGNGAETGKGSDAMDIARNAIERGWNPVPIPRGEKSPRDPGWQNISRTLETLAKYFSGDVNVGAQMGPMSNGLTDVDHDCREAIVLAPAFLPETEAIYGRPGKPRSHRLYYTDDPEPQAWIQWKDNNKKVLLELRMGGDGKGAQSVLPGSVHTSGEIYAWDVDGAPARSTCAELKAACIKLAAASLLARHWPSRGALHDTALGVGGFLARAGWSADEAYHFVLSICSALRDVLEPKKHAKTARDSVLHHLKGKPVRGLPWMIEHFGVGVASAVAKIIDYHGSGDHIEELNQKYCVVPEGSKVRVLSFSQQHGRETVNYMTFADFKNLYMNQLVAVGRDADDNAVWMPVGKYWLGHKNRRQYEGVVFEPCKPHVSDGKLNLWRGWGVEPAPGDWSLMQQHTHEVLAAGDSDYEQYILNFAAWCVQHPDIPAEVALVFKGPEGSGRGIFGRALCRIFGQHAHQISSIKHLTGDFNKHLRDCCLLFADEAFWPGYRSQEGTLKRLITEPTLFIEPKGLDAFEVRNMIHLIMVSNNRWVVPASMDARRFAMFEVAEHKQQDPAWFKPLYGQMAAGGYAAMLHALLARQLGDWHPRQIIRTAALHNQQMISLDSIDPFDAWWFTLISDGVLPGYRSYVTEFDEAQQKNVTRAGDPYPQRAYSATLFKHARESIPSLKRESDHMLGRALRKRGCMSFNYEGRGWTFPPLKEAREEWEKRAPLQQGGWDDELEDWQERTESEPAPR